MGEQGKGDQQLGKFCRSGSSPVCKMGANWVSDFCKMKAFSGIQCEGEAIVELPVCARDGYCLINSS